MITYNYRSQQRLLKLFKIWCILYERKIENNIGDLETISDVRYLLNVQHSVYLQLMKLETRREGWWFGTIMKQIQM